MNCHLLLATLLCLAACSRDAGPTSVAPSMAAPAAVANAAPPSGDPVEGERIARRVGCSGCHGPQGAGEELWEDAGSKFRSANLTEKRELYDDAGLVALLTQGRTHDGHPPLGMPIFMFQRLSVGERRDIIAWIRHLPAVANPSLKPTELSDAVRKQLADGTYPYDDHLPDAGVTPPQERPTERLALGEYLAMTSCTECHGRELRGWGPDDAAPSLVVAKAYSPEAFTRLMRTGITASGEQSKSGLMSGVARYRFSVMTDEEIGALKAFLDARAP